MDEEFLAPYRLLAEVVAEAAEELGDQDVVQMLEMFVELDQSYEGFYKCRSALQSQVTSRDANRLLKQALDHGLSLD